MIKAATFQATARSSNADQPGCPQDGERDGQDKSLPAQTLSMKKYEQKLPCLTVALKLLNFEARDKVLPHFSIGYAFFVAKEEMFGRRAP